MGVHVDDCLATANSLEVMKDVKDCMRKHFEIADLGPVKWILGISVERKRKEKTISLGQTAYVDAVVKCIGLEDTFKVNSPMDSNVKLSKNLGPDSEVEKRRISKIPYLATIGSLMYASMGTRPDITFAVQHLSQFSLNPSQAHWTAAQHVIRYLNATRELKLVLGGKDEIKLGGRVDSDFASNIDDRRSVLAYAFDLGTGTISWSSKKQAMVSISTTEAEYIAAEHGVKEAVWLCTLLKLVGYEQRNPTLMRCDNNSAITSPRILHFTLT
jgi:hypothetical protein